jgi:hypothetical protein
VRLTEGQHARERCLQRGGVVLADCSVSQRSCRKHMYDVGKVVRLSQRTQAYLCIPDLTELEK